MPVTALDAAGKAAVERAFALKYGRYTLPADVQSGLTDYFAAKGRGVTDLPFTIDKDDEASWEQEWIAYLKSAGTFDAADEHLLVAWLRMRSSPSGGRSAVEGIAKVALQALEQHGVVVPVAAAAQLEQDLATTEAGSEQEQCCCSRTAFIILMNRAPDPDESDWWDSQFSSLGGKDGGTINIPGLESYRKLHKPTTSKVQQHTLEMALSSESDFERWLIRMVDALERAALPKAAIRLMRVVSQATTQSGGKWRPKCDYLTGYFFVEFTGLGLPKVMASASALNSMGALAAAHMQMSGKAPPGLGALTTPSAKLLG